MHPKRLWLPHVRFVISSASFDGHGGFGIPWLVSVWLVRGPRREQVFGEHRCLPISEAVQGWQALFVEMNMSW